MPAPAGPPTGAASGASRPAGSPQPPVVVVVGGGIAGLSAAWRLATEPGERRVVLLEAGQRTGGVLSPLRLEGRGEGLVLDAGAESLLARRTEATRLAVEVGLGRDLVAPETARAAIASRADLHPMPRGTLMGVPGDPETLHGLLTPAEVERVRAEHVGEPLTEDVDVAGWVGGRLGPAVVDRLVEPLLGGVYAGTARRLSLRAAIPPLWQVASRGVSVLASVAVRGPDSGSAAGGPESPPGGRGAGPVFAGVRGGVHRLAEALTAALPRQGVALRFGAAATALEELPRGATAPAGTGAVTPATPTTRPAWRVRIGAEELLADAVVVALPAPAAARLLAGVAPAASAELAAVPMASLALATALLPAGSLTGPRRGALDLGRLSGVLVPPVEGRLVKAMTFSGAKWRWVAEAAEGHDVLRLSVGRHGEEHVLERDDDALLDAALADARELLGLPLAPVDRALTRWSAALPQYAVGHLDRVERVRADVAGHRGLAVAGATYDGVGVPATIASAERAVDRVLADLRR